MGCMEVAGLKFFAAVNGNISGVCAAGIFFRNFLPE